MIDKLIKRCPYCGSTNIVYDIDGGIIYCADCGAIIEEFEVEESFETRIVEARHKRVFPLDKVSDEKEKKLLVDFGDVANIFVRRLKLSKRVMDQAMEYFLDIIRIKRKFSQEYLRYLVATLLYIAARQIGQPVSLKNIIKTLNLETEKFSRVLRYAYKILKIQPKPIDPEKYLRYMIEILKINDSDFMKEALLLLNEGKKRGLLSGRDVRGVIGGIIYVVARALGRHVTQRNIAKVCGITEVTIRNRFLEFAKIYTEITGRKVEIRKRTKKKKLKVVI